MKNKWLTVTSIVAMATVMVACGGKNNANHNTNNNATTEAKKAESVTQETTTATTIEASMKLYEQFLKNKVEASYESGSAFHYKDISQLAEQDAWMAIRYEEDQAYADVDNDGMPELTLWGPYGGLFIDDRDGQLVVLAEGAGTAAVLDYGYYAGETFLVYADVSHAGRAMRHFVKYNGKGQIAEEFDLNAEYWDSPNDQYDEKSTFTYKGNSITMDEYEKLVREYSRKN